MSIIRMDPHELREQAALARAAADQAEVDFFAGRDRLSHVAPGFQGAAAQAFNQRWEEWHEAAVAQIEALKALADFLNRAAETVESVDEQLLRGLSEP